MLVLEAKSDVYIEAGVYVEGGYVTRRTSRLSLLSEYTVGLHIPIHEDTDTDRVNRDIKQEASKQNKF